jgi:hypothetical protein
MRRLHRHLALLLGGLGLLALLFWSPRAADRRYETQKRLFGAGSSLPVEEVARAVVAPPPAPQPNPELLKKAEQAFSRSKPPISATAAGAGGPARFVLRDRTASAFFTPQGVSLALLGRMQGNRPDPSKVGWGLQWGIVGAAPVEPRPEGKQDAKVNVLKGKPEDWQVDQATYSRIVYDDVQPGVDMVVEASSHGVKYSLMAERASAIAALRLRYEGASGLRAVDDGKALEIGAGEGKIREDGLVVTQEGRPVEASYRVTGADEYAIVLDGADPDKALVVDPQIGWSTYLGGTLSQGDGTDFGYSIKIDGGGNMYVGGVTSSADFVTTVGAYDGSLGGYQDAFVVKISAAGAVVWSTYLGGSNYDNLTSLAVDASANVYVTGSTDSADFPVTAGVVDSTYTNGEAFVTRINGAGNAIGWSTFLGGSSSEYARSIAVDGAGANVWVAGETYSSDFPTFAGFDSSASSLPDGFVTKLTTNGTAFAWSSYLGGSDSDAVYAIAVDGAGAVYATGYTTSLDFPVTIGAFRTTNSGSLDCFVVKIKPAATSLEWGTYIGGSSYEIPYAIALDTTGNSFITGVTYSTNYPAPGGVITTNAGNGDAFLTKVNATGSNLVFSSYLGGTDYDVGQAVVVDSSGRGIVAGLSYSTSGFPIGANPLAPAPYDTGHNGGADVFVTAWAPTGSSLFWSTWLGGTGYDSCYGMAMDSTNNVLYLTGETSSPPGAAPNAFPLVSPFDNSLSGGEDAFVIRLALTTPAMSVTLGSYLGGTNAIGDDSARRVAVDAAGALYVVGSSSSLNFPTTLGAFQPAISVKSDATVTKFSNLATPVMVWSTYLGGSGYEEPTGIGVDPTNNQVYVVGYTSSTNFPTLPVGAMSGFSDGFVTKLLAGGNGLQWSRFLGGSSDDYVLAMDVNGAGDIAVSGYTYSSNFPLSPSPYQPVSSALPDAFVTLMPAGGVGITWSTYLGGNSTDYPNAIAFNAAGTKIHVAGSTYSSNFPVTAGTAAQPAFGGNADLFVSRFNPSAVPASQLEYSTYLGSTDNDYLQDMDVGPGDSIFLLGNVYHGLFPRTLGPVYAGAGTNDAVIAKISAAGVLQWSRYLGGSNSDTGNQIRVDAGGSPLVVGSTFSIDFPVQGAFQANLAGSADVFITKIDSTGGSLDWSTYLGGSNDDYPYGLALGPGAAVFVVGETNSTNFPMLNSVDSTLQGTEFFITRIDNSNPSPPSALAQFKADQTTGLAVGAWSKETTFYVKGTLGDLDDDTVALQVEIQPIDAAFTNTPSITGSFAASGVQNLVQVTFPATATQQFHWQARTIDVNSRTSTWVSFGGNSDGAPPGTPAARDLGHDISNPTIATSTPITGSVYTTATSPITFTGTAADTGSSGIAQVTWANVIAGPSTFSSGTATGTATWSAPSIALSPGINTITFTATDLAGNTGTKIVTVTYDTTAPVSTITGPTNLTTYLTGTGSPPGGPASGSIALSGTATDNFEIASVGWTNSTGGSGTAALVGTGGNRTWSATITLTPGSNLLTVTALDGANNPHADTITVTYDNTAPAVNITTAPFTTTASTAALLGTASDANGISSVTWAKSGGGGSGTATGTTSWDTGNVIPLTFGANVITVTANDGVVNARSTLNSASTSITLYRDSGAPSITIGSPAPPTFTTGNASITITGTAIDDLNVASVTWVNSLGGSGAATLTGPVTSRSWSADVALLNGTNTVTFTATDGVGQIQTAPIDIIRNNTAPAVVVSSPAAPTVVTPTTPYAMAGTATAAGGKTVTSVTVRNLTTSVFATMTTGGLGTDTATWSAPVDLVIGTNTIEIIATDSVALTTVVNRTIILDPTPPAVTITGPTGAGTYASSANSVTLSGVASDNRGVATITWSNVTTGTLNQAATVSGPPASVTWVTAAIPLGLGTNTINVQATDEAGNSIQDTIQVTYDTASPGITITVPTSASETTTLAASVALGGTAFDAVGLQVVTWLNAATGASGTASGTATWSTPAISLSLGANVLTVLAVDNAGNTQTDTITVYRDGAIPSVAISSPTSDPTLSTPSASIALGGTASDDVQVALVTWSRAPGGLTGSATGTGTWSIASIPLVAGTNTITVTATDGANQSSNDVLTVVYDPTNPTVAITTPASDPYNTTTTPVILAGTAADNVGVTEVIWTNVTTGGSGTASGTTSWNCLAPLTSGSNLITVTAFDDAGNSFSDSITVVYDPAAPLISITSPTTGISIATSSTPLTIGGTASDDVGVATVTWTTSGAVPVTSGTASGTSAWSFSVALAAGENVITVTATDGVGRTGTAFLTIVFDSTPPQVTVTSPTTDAVFLTTQATLTIGGIANDNLNLQSVTWTNAATSAGGSTQGVGAWSIPAMALNEGPNLVTITAKDSVNNSGSDSVTIIYDGSDPTVDITSPLPGGSPFPTSTRPQPISGTATDNLGLASVTWTNSRGGGGLATLTGPSTNLTWSASVYLFTGLNTITVTATDNHGRTATDVIVMDFTPENAAPTIVITSPAGATATSASQVIAIAGNSNDNVGVVAVTWKNQTTLIRGDAVPGTLPSDYSSWTASIPLASGPNVIVVTAVDDAGNIATASVTVTYTPATPDTTDPTVTVTGPTNLDLYTATVSPLALVLDASDPGNGIAGVYWRNAATGGNGTATPGVAPSWSASIGLALGTNVVTVTAVDASGNTATDTLIVTFTPAAPDGISPAVAIVTPSNVTTYNTSTALLSLAGTSSDDTAIATVVWSNPAATATGSAEGTLAWTSDLTLVAGINLITVTAYDTSGNTATSSITVLYTPPPPPPEVVPAGSCGLLGLDAILLLAGLAAWRRRRPAARKL